MATRKNSMKDLVIIGSGPAALSAAVYAAREEIGVTVYEKTILGGLVATIDHIDNYPGFPDGVKGSELVERMQQQAERFGANIEYGEVTAIKLAPAGSVSVTVDDEEVKARAVLVTSGWTYNTMDIPGEADYKNRGVHYCATCDGPFYKDKKIVVVGGGNSAAQEAVFLTRFASSVEILARSTFKASAVLQKKVREHGIKVYESTKALEVLGDGKRATNLKIEGPSGASELPVDGIFVFVGIHPAGEFAAESGLKLDEQGYIKTDLNFQTNLPGVFAAGDIRSGSTKQVVTAAGEGAAAAKAVGRYLAE
ncbi:MAG: FAD-dependent oxidoreductase [Candidatus Nomurabacteria bacterium]|nr:FAD-dependent oxidoreductase [Candidatus Nomurabacteria bacterium]